MRTLLASALIAAVLSDARAAALDAKALARAVERGGFLIAPRLLHGPSTS